jgi:Domain of unknown function (DUF3520)/von Willebrand factor type A domain/von Willebrand factor
MNEGFDNNSGIDTELQVRLMNLVMGEASDFERDQLQAMMEERAELAAYCRHLEHLHGLLCEVGVGEPAVEIEIPGSGDSWQLPAERRNKLLAVLDGKVAEPRTPVRLASSASAKLKSYLTRRWLAGLAVAAASLLLGIMIFPRGRLSKTLNLSDRARYFDDGAATKSRFFYEPLPASATSPARASMGRPLQAGTQSFATPQALGYGESADSSAAAVRMVAPNTGNSDVQTWSARPAAPASATPPSVSLEIEASNGLFSQGVELGGLTAGESLPNLSALSAGQSDFDRDAANPQLERIDKLSAGLEGVMSSDASGGMGMGSGGMGMGGMGSGGMDGGEMGTMGGMPGMSGGFGGGMGLSGGGRPGGMGSARGGAPLEKLDGKNVAEDEPTPQENLFLYRAPGLASDSRQDGSIPQPDLPGQSSIAEYFDGEGRESGPDKPGVSSAQSRFGTQLNGWEGFGVSDPENRPVESNLLANTPRILIGEEEQRLDFASREFERDKSHQSQSGKLLDDEVAVNRDHFWGRQVPQAAFPAIESPAASAGLKSGYLNDGAVADRLSQFGEGSPAEARGIRRSRGPSEPGLAGRDMSLLHKKRSELVPPADSLAVEGQEEFLEQRGGSITSNDVYADANQHWMDRSLGGFLGANEKSPEHQLQELKQIQDSPANETAFEADSLATGAAGGSAFVPQKKMIAPNHDSGAEFAMLPSSDLNGNGVEANGDSVPQSLGLPQAGKAAKGLVKADDQISSPEIANPQSFRAKAKQKADRQFDSKAVSPDLKAAATKAEDAETEAKKEIIAKPNRPAVASTERETKLSLPQGRPTIDEQSAAKEAFSTFSLHVSDVSFKLAQTALSQGQWPDAAKIRIEEFVNALDYRDPLPSDSDKVACRVEQAIHPFLIQRNMLRVSMRTAATGRSPNTPLRLTILLDNSGSMERPDRRQAVLRAFQTLTLQLNAADQVTLISFASTPRLLADKVSGNQGEALLQLIETLPSEGGTNIEAALLLAREKAAEQMLAGAQNRIVLLTDGAVNLGNANPDSLAKLVTQLRDSGIAFDAAGISAHDLNDEVLEALTRQGDGRYYLLDSAQSANENFAKQIAGALRPSAQNVKVQVEFNPQRVGRYKLLGFEKHRLNKEDFKNDKVDAAEMAAAEAGVAVYQYEIKPNGSGDVGSVSVRFRDLATGKMIENRWPIPYEYNPPRMEQAEPTMRLAACAALFAAKLGGGPLADSVNLADVQKLLSNLPEHVAGQTRVQQLRAMVEQALVISR